MPRVVPDVQPPTMAMVNDVTGGGTRDAFRAAAGASFLLLAVLARPAAALERAPPASHQQGFKMMAGLGLGAAGGAGVSNGAVEAQINRSWYGITPVLGLRYDFLFNTPPPPDAWPPGSDTPDTWPDGFGLTGELGIQARPLYFLGPDVYRWIDPYAEAAVFVGAMKERGQYLTSRSLCYGAGVDFQVASMRLDRALVGPVFSAEFREYPIRGDFTVPGPNAVVRAFGPHEILLGVGMRGTY